MNYQIREQIFSKEALSIKDIQDLFGMKYGSAAKIIRDMKLKRQVQGKLLRLDVDGYIHILDYLEEVGVDPLSPGERYMKKKDQTAGTRYLEERPVQRRSLCI